MYLHICKDVIIKKEDIIGIFKMDLRMERKHETQK